MSVPLMKSHSHTLGRTWAQGQTYEARTRTAVRITSNFNSFSQGTDGARHVAILVCGQQAWRWYVVHWSVTLLTVTGSDWAAGCFSVMRSPSVTFATDEG